MSTRTYKQTLREVVAAVEQEEALAEMAALGVPSDGYGTSVNWPWASGMQGYGALRLYVQKRVEAMMPQLIADARAAASAEVLGLELELGAARVKAGKQ